MSCTLERQFGGYSTNTQLFTEDESELLDVSSSDRYAVRLPVSESLRRRAESEDGAVSRSRRDISSPGSESSGRSDASTSDGEVSGSASTVGGSKVDTPNDTYTVSSPNRSAESSGDYFARRRSAAIARGCEGSSTRGDGEEGRGDAGAGRGGAGGVSPAACEGSGPRGDGGAGSTAPPAATGGVGEVGGQPADERDTDGLMLQDGAAPWWAGPQTELSTIQECDENASSSRRPAAVADESCDWSSLQSIYTDDDDGYSLMESRRPPPPLPDDDGVTARVAAMTPAAIRAALKARGDTPGPVTPTTDATYRARLRALLRDPNLAVTSPRGQTHRGQYPPN